MITLLVTTEKRITLHTDEIVRDQGPEGSQAVMLTFPTGFKIKRPNMCDCTSCDIACTCPPQAECFHHADGEGGLCVSTAEGIRLAVLEPADLLGSMGCGCPTPGCLHVTAYLADAFQARQPGPARVAGSQAARKQARDARES